MRKNREGDDRRGEENMREKEDTREVKRKEIEEWNETKRTRKEWKLSLND